MNEKYKILYVLLSLLLLSLGCRTENRYRSPIPPAEKITFDLSVLDAEGLYGPPDGKRALNYEFCIPDTKKCRTQVASIDVTVQFMSASPGRIGCQPDQCLCIGSTHHPRYRFILRNLAQLSYIHRIDQCFFE